MNNEGLKPENIENNKESLLLGKIRRLEENIAELNVENMDLMHDALTGLNTRKYLEERLEETITSLKNPENEKRKDGFKIFSLIFCDIDNFKNINDNLGHNGGDDVLKKVSEIISGSVRNSDIVCRWGGEEIVVALLGADENEAVEKAEEIRIAIEEGMKNENVTLSLGVACHKDGQDMDSIIKQSDEAMYLAKKSGKNNVKRYSDVLNMGKGTE